MEDVAWKCTAAFVLGGAAHYFISSQLLSDSSKNSATSSSTDNGNDSAAAPRSGASSRSSSGSSDDWEGEDSDSWVPHKMVMCVRTDLKMGKGKHFRDLVFWLASGDS
jgi:hypothetical protein